MSDRSAWWRTGAGVAAWLVLAVAASGAAWAAVGVVGDESDPAAVSVPTPGDPASQPTPPTDSGSDSGTDNGPGTGTETEPGGSGGDSRTITSAGGSVTVACTGVETIRMAAALPGAGWQSQVEERGPQEVEVEFVQGDAEVRVRARCQDGVLESDVDGD